MCKRVIRARVLGFAVTMGLTGLAIVGPAQASSSPPSVASQATPAVQAQNCASQGKSGVLACLGENNLALDEALMAYSKLTVTSGVSSEVPSGLSNTAASSGGWYACRTVWDQHTYTVAGINAAWQKLYTSFCYNHYKIWSTSTSAARWSGFLYCWKDTSDWWSWNYYPSWQDSYAQGTYGGNTGFGCLSLGSDLVHINYNDNGYAWYH
jgi:hypothetical protein